MKSILKTIKINNLTYFLLFICLFAGMFKNILLILLIVLIHELGHVYFIKKFDYKIIKVEIFPFGGITKIEKDLNAPINHDLAIACGGFLFQIILYFIVFCLYKLNMINDSTLNLFNTYNNAILIFNLLPIIPLDGYVILKSLLEKFLTFRQSHIVVTVISILGIFFYFNYNLVYSLNNYMIITLLIYKTIIYIKEYKYIYNRFLLERYINTYPYKRSCHEKNISFKRFRKETLHFFKMGNKFVHEREILKKKFDKNRHF